MLTFILISLMNMNIITSPVVGIFEIQGMNKSITFLFFKDNDKWISFQDTNEPRGKINAICNNLKRWIIANNGKELLVISDNNIERDSCLFGKKVNVNIEISELNTFKNTKKSFSNWNGIPYYRPLLALPENNKGKSFQIQIIDLNIKERSLLLSNLKENLTNNKEFNKILTERKNNIISHLKYEAFMIEDSTIICSVELDDSLNKSDGPPSYIWSKFWFVKKNDKFYCFVPIKNDHRKIKMELVDIGDFDNDKNIEMLFSLSGYNKDGYTLVYDQFNKNVEYSWSYH